MDIRPFTDKPPPGRRRPDPGPARALTAALMGEGAAGPPGRVDFRAIALAALAAAPDVCRRWLPDGKRQGPEWVCRNPTRQDERAGSFSVNLDTGRWADFATGDKGGDLIGLVAYLDGTAQGPAAAALSGFLCLPDTDTRPPAPNRPTGPSVESWKAIMPVPADAPPPPAAHPQHGAPTASWEYRNADGALLAVVCRFDPPGQRKQFAPRTWCESDRGRGRRAWRWKAPPEPRPLYGLDRLAARPGAPALLCEGEKAADAAGRLLPDLVAVATMNGAQSPARANWAPLRGRRVLIWPDADEPGAKYAEHAAALALAAGAASAAVLDVTSVRPDAPQGWDAADALAEGLEAARLAGARWLPFDPGGAAPDGAAAGPSDGVTLIDCAALKPEPVVWLWPGWLARGKVHILAGAPGTGKTTAALAMAATLTTAGRWPDGERADAARVVIWSGEDDPRDTLLPRLLAAGADVSRAQIIAGMVEGGRPRGFDPASDVPALMDALQANPPALLIVDPVVSAVAADSHKNAEVRRALQPLVDLAQACRCAVVGITHLTKGTAGRDPVERVTGSLAFGALARVVLLAAKLPEEQGGGRVLVRAKSNLGADAGGFGFDLEPCQLDGYPEITTTRFLWRGPVEGTAREIMGQADAAADPDEQGALADAVGFLRAELADGPVSAKAIRKEADGAGIAWRTVERAKTRLCVESRKDGPRGPWLWALPGQPQPQDRQDCHTQNLGGLGGLGNLGGLDRPETRAIAQDRQDRQEIGSRKVGGLGTAAPAAVEVPL